MLHETFLYLLMIGLFSLVKIQERYVFWFSFILTILTGLVFVLFLMDGQLLLDSPHVLSIGSTVGGNIKLDIISSKQNYMLILPFFANTLLALGNNLIFKYEAHKKTMLSLFIFNLAAFIMLICGNNFIQFMTFVFVIDILSCLLISDANAAKRYSMYNLVADMGIFLVLSMLQGKLANLDAGNIAHYYETGHHRDFIMFTLMLSLFIKFGFIFFQGYWLDLKNAKFHALYFLSFLSTPMAALILFIKFYPIVVVSPSFEPLLDGAVALSMLWGAFGAVSAPQIKEKFFYFHMLCVSFTAKLIELSNFIWNTTFSNILICFFIFSLCFYYLHYEIDREHSKNKGALFLVFAAFFASVIALSLQFFALYTPQSALWILSFGGLFLLAVSQIFISYGAKLRPQLAQKISYGRTALIMLCLLALLFYFTSLSVFENGWILCFVFLFLLFALLAGKKINDAAHICYQKIKHIDLLTFLYEKCVLRVVKNAGIFAHIFIDFVFLERTLWPMISSISTYTVKTYRRANRMGMVYDILCIIIGFFIIFYLMTR